MKLYELTENYNNLLDLLENEEVPKEMLEEALKSVEGDIEEKLENIAKLVKSIDVDIKGYKDEESRLAGKRKALENKQASLKAYIESSLIAIDKKKFKGKIFTLAIQKNAPSVNVVELMDIPKEYLVYSEPTIDKKAILADLKEGKEVPGAELKQSESLRIK